MTKSEATKSEATNDGSTRVALLRGINVGGHRKVPMAELRASLTTAGFTDVATYIQSGNVVFTGGPADDGDASALTASAIVEQFGFEVPVIVRPGATMVALLERSAELFDVVDASTHDKFVNIGFLSAAPSASAVDDLDHDRWAGDIVVVEGDHVHLHFVRGQSQTKMSGDYVERTLGVSMTVRNLATVRKLVDLTRPA